MIICLSWLVSFHFLLCYEWDAEKAAEHAGGDTENIIVQDCLSLEYKSQIVLQQCEDFLSYI